MGRKAGFNEKQRRFVEEYGVDCNGTQAAIRAGYSAASAAKTAFELLQRPQIQDAVTAMLSARTESARVSKEWLIDKTKEVLTATVGTKSHNATLRGIELLAKLTGNLIERRETRRVTNWADLTDEEVRNLAGMPANEDRKSTRLNSSHITRSRMPSSA